MDGLPFHRTAFGAQVDGERFADVIASAPGTFVGLVRSCADGATWAYSDQAGEELAPLIAAAATRLRTTLRVHTVRIEMMPLRRIVTWRLFPRSASVMPRARTLVWTPDQIPSQQQDCTGTENLDDLALRGGWFADEWIARRIGSALVVSQRELRVENPARAAVPRRAPRSARLKDLLDRARTARSVAWEAQTDGREGLSLELADGSIVRSILDAADARALREALGGGGRSVVPDRERS